MNKKQRIIKWLSIFLLVVNISAFGTILILNNNQSKSASVEGDYYQSDVFLQKELNLNEAQLAELEKLDHNIFRSYQVLLDLQCEANFSLLEELLKVVPDENRLDSIADKFGKYQTSIKRQTIKHFTNLRKICTEEQSVLLDQMIKNMIGLGDQCGFCNKETCTRRESLNQ